MTWRHRSAALALLFAVSSAQAGEALSPSESDPRVIMDAVYRAGSEAGPRAGKLRLLTRRDGSEREHVMDVRYKSGRDTRRSFMYVVAPASERGTGFVSLEYAGDREAERWLYLTALRRSTRVAGGQLSGSFLASDFHSQICRSRIPITTRSIC
jgi:hypothetical protein